MLFLKPIRGHTQTSSIPIVVIQTRRKLLFLRSNGNPSAYLSPVLSQEESLKRNGRGKHSPPNMSTWVFLERINRGMKTYTESKYEPS